MAVPGFPVGDTASEAGLAERECAEGNPGNLPLARTDLRGEGVGDEGDGGRGVESSSSDVVICARRVEALTVRVFRTGNVSSSSSRGENRGEMVTSGTTGDAGGD